MKFVCLATDDNKMQLYHLLLNAINFHEKGHEVAVVLSFVVLEDRGDDAGVGVIGVYRYFDLVGEGIAYLGYLLFGEGLSGCDDEGGEGGGGSRGCVR